MEYIELKDYLNNKGMSICDLNVLAPDENLYSTLLFQPEGKLEASDSFVRNADRESAKNKFSNFVRLCVEENQDLCLTPEYSMPYETIINFLENKTFPAEEKLW